MEGTISINGIRLDIPTESDLRKWDYSVVKDGRTTYSTIWLDEYLLNGTSYERHSHELVKTSRGSILLDGKRVTDKTECEEALKIFNLGVFGKSYHKSK